MREIISDFSVYDTEGRTMDLDVAEGYIVCRIEDCCMFVAHIALAAYQLDRIPLCNEKPFAKITPWITCAVF